jgi:hypothetical protein
MESLQIGFDADPFVDEELTVNGPIEPPVVFLSNLLSPADSVGWRL